MSFIEKSIELRVPVRTAYNQWTQFEEFPTFMEGVKTVRQIDDRRLQWRANIAGKDQEWNAEITEQTPDERIAWGSRGGAMNAGMVTFHRLSDVTSKLILQLEYHPQGFVEKLGDAMGFVAQRVHSDLKRFKTFIESRGQETDAWRGTITRWTNDGSPESDNPMLRNTSLSKDDRPRLRRV
jgi:uncharacterized membrane protein